MKKLGLIALLLQIFILSSLWTGLYAATWLGNVGSYNQSPDVVYLGSGPLEFSFPPNSSTDFTTMTDCIDNFPDDFLYVEYHVNHSGKLIIDYVLCFEDW